MSMRGPDLPQQTSSPTELISKQPKSCDAAFVLNSDLVAISNGETSGWWVVPMVDRKKSTKQQICWQSQSSVGFFQYIVIISDISRHIIL